MYAFKLHQFLSIVTILFVVSYGNQTSISPIREKSPIQFVNPIKQADFKYISSRFGWRIHPLNRQWHFHKGIDIVPHNSTARIHCTAAGIIVAINQLPEKPKGLWICIQHAEGYQSIYAHLGAVKVQVGQKVVAGQIIGIVGSTGLSSGVHLHYELQQNGQFLNPLLFNRS